MIDFDPRWVINTLPPASRTWYKKGGDMYYKFVAADDQPAMNYRIYTDGLMVIEVLHGFDDDTVHYHQGILGVKDHSLLLEKFDDEEYFFQKGLVLDFGDAEAYHFNEMHKMCRTTIYELIGWNNV